jgi:hypothetical protein
MSHHLVQPAYIGSHVVCIDYTVLLLNCRIPAVSTMVAMPGIGCHGDGWVSDLRLTGLQAGQVLLQRAPSCVPELLVSRTAARFLAIS